MVGAFIISILVSVTTGVIANTIYGVICKWLNERRK